MKKATSKPTPEAIKAMEKGRNQAKEDKAKLTEALSSKYATSKAFWLSLSDNSPEQFWKLKKVINGIEKAALKAEIKKTEAKLAELKEKAEKNG